ncbi:hypothetical protein C8A05DRAFT_38653 [Staphylotrichum tortipilum]|uniref:Uncharacterized protein n=1 Tax=Staphylotrichum tortipilum TaxID=2831512 RepID=A0AAN6MBK1_9PEZI|nr:hypothetical protein C8A05DRAFT_38653 [Staphylotrichum longicolle]
MFTPFLMFAESLRQRALFVSSRRSLDARGYVLRELTQTLTEFEHPFLDERDYAMALRITPNNLASLERDLARHLSVNLVKPLTDLTLAGRLREATLRLSAQRNHARAPGYSWTRRGWNCTFGNGFTDRKLTGIAGKPEIHWDNASDLARNSRYILPDRFENL